MRNRKPRAMHVVTKEFITKPTSMLEWDCSSPRKSRKVGLHAESNKFTIAHEMDVQIPHRLHTEVQKEGDIWTVQRRPAGNNTDTLQVQGHRNSGRPHDAGSRTSTAKYTTKIQRILSDGISQSLLIKSQAQDLQIIAV